jgi:CAAX prenyl protease-like protein
MPTASTTSGAAHVVPYVLFVAIGASAAVLPEPLRPWADPARAVAAAAALVFFARRGAYPDLAPAAPRRRGAGLLAVAAGVAAALLWMPLADLVPPLGARGGFDPRAAGDGAAVALLWAGRLLGSLAVVPFAEELLVRSFVPRYVDAPDGWSGRAVGSFTPASAAVSLALFTVSHPEWLAALAAGLLWTGLLAATGRLRDAVAAHAVANGLLAAWVVATGDTRWW